MKKIITFLSVFIFLISPTLAYDIILPKEKKNITNNNYAFFVGQAKNGESISINDEHITTASNGAFAHSVKLKDGENRIFLSSGFGTKMYKFYKNPKPENIKPTLLEFDSKTVRVAKDNTPLRSTPVDYGMNRLSHLFEGTYLIVDGEENGFYRVFLSKNKTGWISKDAVCDSIPMPNPPEFITMNSETFKNASIHTIEFTEKLPYTIEETDKEILFRVYNPQAAETSFYTINIRKPDKYVYSTFSSNGVYVFKVNQLPIPENPNLEGLNITVDPGHGGSELGAIGCTGEKEKNINLAIALELKELLTNMGACVTMTRECDANVSLEDRVKIAKESFADIFVSVHLNSIPDIPMNIHKNRGTSVYYYNPNSQKLAKFIEDKVAAKAGTRKDGVRTASFAVTRPTDYVGILVECAYMTNPYDSVLYTSEDFARNTASGIAEGILEYANSNCN